VSARTVMSVDGVEAEVSHLERPAEIRSEGNGDLAVQFRSGGPDQNGANRFAGNPS
jgi:hypothetical protein